MIGFYGGTFDPIHFGHLNLALELLEAHGLSEVWFCPARLNPHRQQEPPTPIEHRLEMVSLAIADIPQFRLITLESRREGPSYTIDTLKEIFNTQPPPEPLCLLMGDDAIPGFFKWRHPEEIIDLVPLLIGSRHPEEMTTHLIGEGKIVQAMRKGLTKTHLLDISGTEIRKRLKEGLYCGHLVPAKVLDYIYENDLYFKRF